MENAPAKTNDTKPKQSKRRPEQTIPQTATTSSSPISKLKGAKSMLGFAATFRETKTTEEWMKELREGERS